MTYAELEPWPFTSQGGTLTVELAGQPLNSLQDPL